MLKFIKKIFNKRFDRYYRHKRWRLILDSALIVVIFLLAIAIFSLNFYQPKVDLNFFPKAQITFGLHIPASMRIEVNPSETK